MLSSAVTGAGGGVLWTDPVWYASTGGAIVAPVTSSGGICPVAIARAARLISAALAKRRKGSLDSAFSTSARTGAGISAGRGGGAS